jgi:hypothetical protein
MKKILLATIVALAMPTVAMAASTNSSTLSGQSTSASGAEAILAPNTTYNSYTPSNETLHDNTQAPDVVVSGANQCALPIGASTSILGVGVGLAATPTDKGCERRDDAAALLALHLPGAAVATMCQDKNVAKAMNTAGTPCDIVEARLRNITLPPEAAAYKPSAMTPVIKPNTPTMVCHEVFVAPANPNGAGYMARRCTEE